MEAVLFVVACLLAWWIKRTASRSRKNESLIATLTARVFHLEEELKQLRPAAPPAPAPAPVVSEPAVELPPEPEAPPPAAPPEPLPMAPLPAPAFASAQPRVSRRKLLNLEEALGTNWLNKLGIIILVIGVALFLTYQLREVGPAGKVLTGFSVAAAMLAAGVFFERRTQWRIIARAGIAGGWSMLYFTTYAMTHVAAARVISSESVDLALLLVAAGCMTLHTLRYKSQVVTGLAFLLAFTTINLSRGDPYSLIASAILAAALAWIAVRRQWFEMELAGMAAAYLNHYLWLRPVIEPMHGHLHAFPGYVASAALLYSYWLIFRASYVIRHPANPRQELVSTFAALLNPALFIALSGYQSLHPELAFQFFLSIGIVEFVVGQLPITRRRRSAFIVLTALGSALLAAAFPYRYAGAPLSASWLAEAEALLLAGVLLREVVFRRIGMLVALAAWIQMIGGSAAMVLGERMYHVRESGRPGLALLFAVAAAMFWVDSHWIPRRWPHLIDSALERLCFRRLSRMASILAIVGAWIAWPHAWTAVAWAALGAALALAGRRWSQPDLSFDAYGCAAAAVLRVLAVNLSAAHTYPHLPWLTERLLTVALVVVLLYLGSRWAGLTGVRLFDRISPGYTWAASGLAGLLAWYELHSISVALAWTILGVVLLEAGLHRAMPHLRWQAYTAFVASFLRIFFVNLNAPAGARVYTTVPLILAFYYVYGRVDQAGVERRFHLAAMHAFFGAIAFAALLRFELDPDFVVVGWAALALLLMAIAWRTGRRIFLDQGLLMAAGVLFRGALHNLYERSYLPAPFGRGRIASVGSSAALLFLALPFAFRLRSRFPNRKPEQVLFFIPFVLLTILLALEMRHGLVTLAWGLEAVGVFLLALRVNERSFRLAGLGLLMLCVAKIIFQDVWRLAPRDRYLTFIVLGSALLAVSYLYTRYRDVLRQYL